MSATTERIIRPSRGLIGLNLGELWRFRELLGQLAWRDVLIRYKQTYLGVAWAVLQPVLTVVVFTIVFGKMAKFDTGAAAYPIFTLAALLPWQFFANALTESSGSLVAASRIISKVYFPRLIIPVSAVLSGALDALIATVLLFILMPCFGVPFRVELLLLPLFFLAAALPAFAAGVWFSALNVKYRDVRYVVPFLTRLGMFATPIYFAWQTVLPEKWRLAFHLNPLVGVADGFRWCVFGPFQINDGGKLIAIAPWWPGFWMSMALSLLVLLAGLVYFRQVEKTFADVV